MTEQPSRRIVIVGGVAGGASAATRARRMNEHAQIIMLEKDEHVSFANCGLPYYIGDEIADRNKLLVATPRKFRDWFNIDARTRNEATAINRDKHTVSVRDHVKGEDYELPYDRLILAPGASPIVPPVEGVPSQNVFTLRNLADTDAIKTYIQTRKPRRIVVVGAGFIGLEMVEMLCHLGLEVALVELLDQVMPPLDPEMAHVAQRELEAHGIELHLGDGLVGFEINGTLATAVKLNSGAKVTADAVILGIGVRPNTKLATDAGLVLTPDGGIAVNQFMQTSDPHIYAAGDAVAYRHGVTGKPMRIPLAGPANRAGRIAGEHAAADIAPPMRDVLGTAIVRIFGVTAGMTGLSRKLADKLGIRHAAVWVSGGHHAGYYPGAQPMTLKLIYCPDTGKALGAQIVGGDGVDKRIDVIATALGFGATVYDLAGLDLAYAPPYGSAKDPVHQAAFVAQNALRKLGRIVPPAATRAAPDSVQWLDVRNPDEWKAGHLQGATWIPLHELRGRLDELDPRKPVVTICRGGQRAYYATRILQQHGFVDAATLSGGMAMQEHVG